MAKISHLLRDLQFLAHFLAAVAVTGCTTVEFAEKVSVANPLDPFESELLTDVNEMRKAAGVGTVENCASLNVAASAHSDDMRDKNYLSDVAPDKSTTPTRACAAGYQPACADTAGMVEFLANGHGEATITLDQWKKEANSTMQLTAPEFVVAGIGRSLGGEKPIWTMVLADKPDGSCTAAP